MTPAQAEAARGRLEAFINSLIEASISALTERRARVLRRLHRAGRHPGPAVLPRPVQARRPVRQRPRRRLVRPRRRPPRTRRRQRKAAAQDRLGAGGHHRHHGPPARRAARAPQSRHRPGADPARRRPRRHRRPRAGLPGRPRPQARLARLRPRLHPGPTRAIPPARTRAGLLARSWTTAPTSSASRPTPAERMLVEGTWYCPALPGPLITATTSLRDHAITRDLYDQQITARCPYQLKRKDGPDADGYQRLSCPAAGTRPRLICPLRQASLSPRDGRAKVLQPPPEPPRICRQTAITIAPDTGARYRQDLPYGSPAWHARYATLRNTIEGLNGLRQRPRPRSPRPARPPPRPRHRRPVDLHRAAADGRQHPQDPRLAGPDRPRQDPHHPAGTPAAGQPARLPPRRLTGTSSPRHLDTFRPAGQPRPGPARSTATGPPALRERPDSDQHRCQSPASY